MRQGRLLHEGCHAMSLDVAGAPDHLLLGALQQPGAARPTLNTQGQQLSSCSVSSYAVLSLIIRTTVTHHMACRA